MDSNLNVRAVHFSYTNINLFKIVWGKFMITIKCDNYVHQKCGIMLDNTCKGWRSKCPKFKHRDAKRLKFNKADFVRIPSVSRVLKTIHGRVSGKDWRTKPIMKVIERARQDLGYSDRTNDVDIIIALYKASRSGK